jgi:hypothetical protein
VKKDRYTKEQIRAGKITLAEFIESLKDRNLLPPPYTPSVHPLGYMNADNILAIVVLRRNGGWVGDVVFNDVPSGFPEVTGTADSRPFACEEDALFAALKVAYQVFQRPVPIEDIACMAFQRLGVRLF